jgi:hypothetical protein
MEVENMPKHTGVDDSILVKDFGTLFVDAEVVLQEEKDLDLQRSSSRAPDARRHDGRKMNPPSNLEFLPRTWGGRRLA